MDDLKVMKVLFVLFFLFVLLVGELIKMGLVDDGEGGPTPSPVCRYWRHDENLIILFWEMVYENNMVIKRGQEENELIPSEWMEGRPPSMAHLFRFVFVSLYLSAMNRVRHVYRWGENSH